MTKTRIILKGWLRGAFNFPYAVIQVPSINGNSIKIVKGDLKKGQFTMTTIFRARLLGSSLLAGTALLTAPAFAQSTPPLTTAPATTTTVTNTTAQDQAPQSVQNGDIIVTGTLIRNPNLISTSPVGVIGSEEIQLRGSQTAEQILRNLPGSVPSIGSAVNNGQGGASYVNLRGLGRNRNLVLIDGDRIAPSDSDGAVDLNNIPLALLSKLDVLTGGASTTYGADAVAGVVNFITRRDFAGVDASASQQISERGDGSYFRADLVLGANFDDGRGNAVLAMGYQESDPVYQGARDFSTYSINSTTGRGSGASPTSTPTAVAFDDGSFQQVNQNGTALVPQYAGFNFNPYNVFQTPFKRFNIYSSAHYDASDTIEVYGRGMFSKNTVKQIIAPSGIFGDSLTIPANNPYLNDTIRQQICSAEGIPAAQCTSTSTTALPLPGVYRRLVELGPRIGTYVSTVFDYRAGVRIRVTNSIKLDVSGSYGESNKVLTNTGYTLNDRFQQALNANNTSTCLNTANNCVPLNLFGPSGSITPAQVAFIGAESIVQINSQLSQAKALLSGDFGVTSPLANDAIGFAVGAEYRSYGLQQIPDAYSEQGLLGGSGGPTTRFSGSYNVREAFGELIAPLVADRPGIQTLSVEGGIRYSSYNVKSQGNPSFQTTTWKAGATYAPFSGLKFRGNYQRAVRAPNIGELFLPVSTSLTNLTVDPCQGTSPVGNANLAAICQAQGAPANRVTAGTIPAPAAGQANVTSGGNPNIKPETANTITAGVVIEPRNLVPGLTISADYYNIRVKGAIGSYAPGDVIQACFGSITAASATSAACQAIQRNPSTGALSGPAATTKGLITQLSNLGYLLTDGVDLNVNYNRDLGFAGLDLSFVGNWTSRSISQVAAGFVRRDCVGYFSANCASIQPEFYWNQRTTLTFGKIDASVLWRHISAVQYEGQAPDYVARGYTTANRNLFSGVIGGVGPMVGQAANFNKIGAYNYIDLAFRFRPAEHLELTITATNLFDKAPPLVGAQAGSTSYNSGNTYPSTYDALGRMFNVGARIKF